MKKAYLITIAVLAIALLAVSHVGQASPFLLAQEQTEKKKEEQKEKGESATKISGELGTQTNPVRCYDPKGERQYLNRLRCPDNNRPVYSRIGSFGIGPYGNILDGYGVKCEGKDEVTIFMDMYHKDYIEKAAVPGFTIVDK
jgi:hypothetical protein